MKLWLNRFLLLLAVSIALSGEMAFAGPLKEVGNAYAGKKVAEKMAKREIKKKMAKEAVLKGELQVGRYEDLLTSRRLDKRKDLSNGTVDAHHMPSARYLKEKNLSPEKGIAIEMQPQRHTQTRTYGGKNKQLLTESPRDALARDVKDVKKVYRENGLYDEKVRKSLKDVIHQNKTLFHEVYKK